MLTLAGGADVISLSFLGLFLFPTLFPVEDPAVADQFLKGETVTVHQVEATTSELQLHDLLLGLQLSGGCLYLVHHHGLPLEELVRHSWVLHREEGGEEEEAQEGEADDLRPASQPGSASQWSDETRILATATGGDPELVFTSISLDRDNSRSADWILGLTIKSWCWRPPAGSAAPAG